MNKIKFISLVSTTLLGFAFPAWAGPRGGGGGFTAVVLLAAVARWWQPFRGGSRAAPAFYGGGFRGAPVTRGAYFTGRSVGRPSAAPDSIMVVIACLPWTAGIHSLSRSIYDALYRQIRCSYSATKPCKLNCRAKPRYGSAISTAANGRPDRAVAGRNRFRIHGPRPQLTDSLRQIASHSSRTTHLSVMMGTGTATGTGIIHISTTIKSLFLSMASGGAWIPGSIRTMPMTTHTMTTAIIRTTTVMVIPITICLSLRLLQLLPVQL